MNWRLLAHDDATAAGGLATDETLARRVGTGESPPTLRLYTYRPHAALVGRFQDVRHELDVDYCARHDIAINRRPTGGGAILMGPDQLGVALAVPGRGRHSRPRELMARFSEGLVLGLAALGVTATFQGKNDLEVGGKKIAGLGIYRDPSRGLLFHASLLVDLDVELMSRVLRTPFEKLTDKEIATVAGRTATVRRFAQVSMPDVRRQVEIGFADAFGVALDRGELLDAERAEIETVERDKYRSDEWLRQSSGVADLDGAATKKTASGLLEVRVALSGRTLKAVYLRGDFFAADATVADLERQLRWHSAVPERIAATVHAWSERHADAFEPALLTRTITAAIENAAASPYGCFLSPGGRE